jgi:hypothetical protein
VVEEGDFEGVAGGKAAVAAMQVCVDEGELEGFGSLGNDEGLAEVAEVGGVFAEDGLTVDDLAVATGIPICTGVESAVVDPNECACG